MVIRSYNNVICREIVFLRRGELLSECEKRVGLMEKEILYFTGRKRTIARRRYFRLLKSCNKEVLLEKPTYLKRS